MQIIHATVENFGSYKHLEFKFTEQGLTLISGPTGAGKSTLCDVVPWILFGITSKNGAVDEVRNWSTEESTVGCITLMIKDKIFQVIRSRGPNDLAFWTDGGVQRGKDLNDTQKIINNYLGIIPELYLAGAYFHEFSEVVQFFTTTAKTRRQITEQLVDLSLAVKLNEGLKEYKTSTKAELTTIRNDIQKKQQQIQYLEQTASTEQKRSDQWKTKQASAITEMRKKAETYDVIKTANIMALTVEIDKFESKMLVDLENLAGELFDLECNIRPDSEYTTAETTIKLVLEDLKAKTCTECGAPKDTARVLVVTKDLYTLQNKRNENNQRKIALKSRHADLERHKSKVNPFLAQIEQEKLRENTYTEQLKTLMQEKNPYAFTSIDAGTAAFKAGNELIDMQRDEQALNIEISDVELMLNVIANFRGILIENVVSQIERCTNKFLNEHFDSEITVRLSVETADKLDVTIHKDGNTAAYTQLSKGQRQLLKLCFGISVMKAVSMNSGIDFNILFFDEFADGLDEDMKIKAFGLLNSIKSDYESIFCIDHSPALKSMFSNQYDIRLVDGVSEIGQSS